MNDTDETRASPLIRLKQKFTTRLATEDIVIVSVIALGFLGSSMTYAFKVDIPPIVIAVLLGSAVSALVYRFLGGIPVDTTFTVGALKLGGTMAALVGCAYFINTQLEKQTLNLDKLFVPHFNEWFAMQKQVPVPIEVKVRGRAIPKPGTVFRNAPLGLERDGADFVVSPKDDAFPLGRLTGQELQRAGLFNSLAPKLEPFLVTPRLPPDSANYDMDPIPFQLSTKRYGGDFSRFVLVDGQGKEVHRGSIYRKQTEIVRIGEKRYLIAVVEVDHEPAEGRRPYAKFAMGEIQLQVEF